MARKKTPPWNGLSPYCGGIMISHLFVFVATLDTAIQKEKQHHVLDP
jgi:hypothetical protein